MQDLGICKILWGLGLKICKRNECSGSWRCSYHCNGHLSAQEQDSQMVAASNRSYVRLKTAFPYWLSRILENGFALQRIC